MSQIRDAAPEDMPQLAGLLDEYLDETFHRRWRGAIGALTRDVLGVEASTLVAVDDGELVGFSIWQRAYDVHHCLHGGTLLDLYVQRPHRGASFTPELLLATVAKVAAAGGSFLRGQSVNPSASRLYERLAVRFPGTELQLGGRAFRELAALQGRPLREVIRALPPRSANLEP
jgi:GNAT superfamily N-acetyltransferase